MTMVKIRELFQRFEWKISTYFAGSVFFIVFLFGFINKIPGTVIFQRLLIAEIFFIPLGYGLGYIVKIIINEQKQIDRDILIEDAFLKKEQGNIIDHEVLVPQPHVIFDEIEDKMTTIASQKKESTVKQEKIDETSSLEQYHTLKNLTKNKNLGKYMIINDKKIINEPEIMAKAVRTMLNREEES